MANNPIHVSESSPDSGHQGAVTRLFEALADPRRRWLLAYLRDHGAESPEALARTLTDWESHTTGITPTAADYGRIRDELVGVHLPTLAAVSLVEYTEDQEMIALTARSMCVFDCIEDAAHCRSNR